MTWPIITTDSHHGIPFELGKEMPAKWRDYLPRIEERDDGSYLVRPQFPATKNGDSNEMADRMTSALSAGIKVDLSSDRALRQLVTGNCAPLAAPGVNPRERLVEMELEGVIGEVLIGNGAFGQLLPDDDANFAWTRLVNDYMADTYKDHLGQFAPGIILPLHDLELAAQEVTRCAAMGMRPIVLPEVIAGKPYSDPMWEPVWEAAAAARVPVFLHLTGNFGRWLMSGVGASTPAPGTAITAFAATSAAAMVSVGWFVNSGVLERHPDLQIAIIECNAGWLAYAMQQWDHAMHGRYAEVASRSGVRDVELEAPPSYYVRRQVKCQFMWDPAAVSLRHEIGMDVLMWGNDYPHMEGAFPDSQLWVDKLFAGIPENEVLQIVNGNAAKLCGFTV